MNGDEEFEDERMEEDLSGEDSWPEPGAPFWLDRLKSATARLEDARVFELGRGPGTSTLGAAGLLHQQQPLRWSRGWAIVQASAEQIVARSLKGINKQSGRAFLYDRCFSGLGGVLPSPLPGHNVDLLAIDSRGILVVEVLSWRGRVSVDSESGVLLVDGRPHDAIVQALAGAHAVACVVDREISVWRRVDADRPFIRPVVCVVGTFLEYEPLEVDGVIVLSMPALLHAEEGATSNLLDPGTVEATAALLTKKFVPAWTEE